MANAEGGCGQQRYLTRVSTSAESKLPDSLKYVLVRLSNPLFETVRFFSAGMYGVSRMRENLIGVQLSISPVSRMDP